MTLLRARSSRRRFLSTAMIGGVAGGLPAWFLERNQLHAADAAGTRSANDRPGILLVGCGGMGRGDAQNATRFGDIVAVCDVDAEHAAAAVKQFSKDGKSPKSFGDFRKALEHPGVDVVIQATPDHWHTLVNLAAIKAGKDVYGEKPLTLTIDEGRRLAQAVRERGAVFQTGTQQRSDRRFRLACELVRSGRLGQLKQVTVYLPAGLREGPFKPMPVPAGLDWDFWQGQAPAADYLPQRCHTTFRYWLEYSGGTMTDWGAHHNDIVRWAVDRDGPVAVEATVLAEPIPGGYTAISEYEVAFTYDNGVRHIARTTKDDNIFGGVVNKDGQRNGIKFEGTRGWIWVNRGDLTASDDALVETPLPSDAVRLEVSDDHMGNFFQCVRSRKTPVAGVEVGHRSASLCHLAAIALQLRAPLQWDPVREQFVGAQADAANARRARAMRAPYTYEFVG